MATADANRAYYDQRLPGLAGYWRYMPAARLRRRRVLAYCRHRAPPRIGDFGCGDGALLGELHALLPAAELFGLDLSAAQIAANQQRLPFAAFAVADLAAPDFRLPFAPCALAISAEVIEHVAAPTVYLRNLYTALLPGGSLLLSTQSGPLRATERHVGHVRHWSAADMTQALTATGFADVHVWNEGWPFHDWSKWLANLRPERSIAHFGTGEYHWPQRLSCAVLGALFRLNSRRRGAQLFACAHRPSAGVSGPAGGRRAPQ